MKDLKEKNLVSLASRIAPRAGWNAETSHKFVREYDGSFYLYDPESDLWFFGIGASEDRLAPVTDSEVYGWIKDLADSIGYVFINSVSIPAEYVNVAAQWHSGQDCLLYAVSSTKGLTTGTHRPYDCDTDEKWYLHLWRNLGIDIARARMLAERDGDETLDILIKFENFADKTCAELEAAYELGD